MWAQKFLPSFYAPAPRALSPRAASQRRANQIIQLNFYAVLVLPVADQCLQYRQASSIMALSSLALWVALHCSFLFLSGAHFGGEALLHASALQKQYSSFYVLFLQLPCLFLFFVGLSHIPETGNLAVGRILTASSTCGFKSPETFCSVGSSSSEECGVCDSRNESLGPPPPPRTWWQSSNNIAPVTLEVSLGTAFFTHVLLSFRSPRPAAMVIEKSTDSGRTYQKVQFYSNDCVGDFGLPDTKFPSTMRNASCTSTFSNIQPLMNGEVKQKVCQMHCKSEVSFAILCIRIVMYLVSQLLQSKIPLQCEVVWIFEYT